MVEAFREILNVFEHLSTNVDEYRELDGERVLVLTHRSGRGKTSGLELEHMSAKGAHLVHVRGGKVTKFIFYWDRERALADLGLAA